MNASVFGVRARGKQRSGLSLLEIVLAMTLAVIAISLLGQLVSIGNRAAAVARDQSKAQMVAESVMAEITSGVAGEPASTSGDWTADPTFSYDVEVTPSSSGTINIITVTVTQNAAKRPATFSLTQWLAIPPEPEEEETTETEGAAV